MAAFNDESVEPYDCSTESDESRDDNNDVEGRENSAKMKSLRANVDWGMEAQRREFLARLYPLVQNWRGRLPDLRDVFRPEEIDWLLAEEVTCLRMCLGCDVHALPIVDFVIASGYEDRPEQQPHQPSSPLRVTPLHAVAGRRFFSWDTAVRRLFRIYNQFEVNYVDHKGLTHFHIACMAGCDDVVRKFIELGRVDPDLPVPETGDLPLHLALAHCRIEVMRALLSQGANPNLANRKSLTPLLMICMRRGDSDLLDLLFEHAQERHRPLPIDARDPWGSTPLNLALFRDHEKVAKALLRYGADPNVANEDGTTPLHTIYDKRLSDRIVGLAEMYFRICDERQRRVDIDARDLMGRTPLHLACNHANGKAIELLLRRGADPSLASEMGLTALHVACLRTDDGHTVELIVDVAREVGRRPVLIDARDKQGDTALHLALELGHMQSAEALLRRGADPNLANEAGSTPLHVICSQYHNLTELFFEVCDEIGREVRLDARDCTGDTPLHLALDLDEPESAECLLRRGADWNLANVFGQAALHIICDETPNSDSTDRLAELIFELAAERGRPVLVNALGNLGYAPLHFALRSGNRRLTALLLRKGADANLTTEHGSFTPLHVVCKREEDDGDLVKLFFDVNAEIGQTVRMDCRDGTGLTPLQWAIRCLLPRIVDVLLDQGADLSGFVFPAWSNFVKSPEPGESWRHSKSKLVAGVLAVVESLERRGYELDRTDALTIMSLFAEYRIFETTADLKKSWYDDDAELVRKAKELRVTEDLSLDNLIEAPLEVAARLLGHADLYLELARSLLGLRELPKGCVEALDRHLCEKMSRRFFRSWALEPFLELTRCRLPLLCCDMVIDNLSNEDLYNICSAAEGHNTV
ncbi:hypothetical protein TKK_0003862 [Trichogramma kaykai]